MKDRLVTFRSHLGNSFVAPSEWEAEDKGDTYLLRSPDGNALIQVLTLPVKGGGSIEEFRETILKSHLPPECSGWTPSEWSSVEIGDSHAICRHLVPIPTSNQEWRVYVLQSGRLYHAIVLTSTAEGMVLDGEFYESIVRSFESTYR